MKEWFETIFTALKTWQVGAVLAMSASANIYMALWNRELTDKVEGNLRIVIEAKSELNKEKSKRIAELEDEVADLKRSLRDTAQ